MLDQKDFLVQTLARIENRGSALKKLVENNILSAEEAAMLNVRAAAVRLDCRVSALVEKTKDLCDAV